MDSSDIMIAAQQGYDEDNAVVASNGTVYLVAWADRRNSSLQTYATRVSNSGQVLDGTGFTLCSSSINLPWALSSNGTDFLAVWADYRNPPYVDLYGARVTGSGTVVDTTGLAVSANTASDEGAAQISSNGTDYLVVWRLRSVSGPSTSQILGSRISASASSTSAVLDTTSLVLSASSSYNKRPTVASAGLDYLVAWDDVGASSGTSDLYNAWVSSTGTVTSGSGFPLTGTVSSLDQTEPAVASNGSNYLVVWTDTESGGAQQIYGARVSLTGNLLDAPYLALTDALRERQSPAVASNGTDYFVTWMDYRNTNWDIYGTRVLGSSSSAVVDPDGIAISTDSAFQNAPAVASDGTDYLVVWRQDPASRGDIYGARVTSTGEVLDTSGIAISTDTVEHYTPRVASNGSNYLVVWAEYQETTSWDTYAARVSTEGEVLDTSGIAISTAEREQYDPDVASDGTDYFAVWTDYRSGTDTDVYGARVSGSGVVQDTSGLGVCTSTVQQASARVTYDGTSYVTTWADFHWDSNWAVFATQVTSSGIVSSEFAVTGTVRPTNPDPIVASAGGQQSFIVFSQYDVAPDQGSRRIHGRFLSF
jgi:hypothetical protein